MNWFTNLTRPGLKKKQSAADARTDKSGAHWMKCPLTDEPVFIPALEASHWVTPAGYHLRIGPQKRFKQVFDDGSWRSIPLPKPAVQDPLEFKDDKKYTDRLRSARAKVGRDDCMDAAIGLIGGAPAVVLVQDFEFMGGSLGQAAGEAFIAAARFAIKSKAAFICVASSGGARMQEGVLSLMQMPRTTLAVQEVKAAGLPYIVILADPVTGGVTASYAMLGDVHIAEPGAVIGFAGPRVIENTIRQKLPEGFQRSEFLLEKGMVDLVVDRREMKGKLVALLEVLMAKTLAQGAAEPAPAANVAQLEPRRTTAAAPRRPVAKAAE